MFGFFVGKIEEVQALFKEPSIKVDFLDDVSTCIREVLIGPWPYFLSK